MKKLIVIMLLALPIIGQAQKIAQSDIDKFSGKLHVESTMESLVKKNKFKNQWNEFKCALSFEDF